MHDLPPGEEKFQRAGMVRGEPFGARKDQVCGRVFMTPTAKIGIADLHPGEANRRNPRLSLAWRSDMNKPFHVEKFHVEKRRIGGPRLRNYGLGRCLETELTYDAGNRLHPSQMQNSAPFV